MVTIRDENGDEWAATAVLEEPAAAPDLAEQVRLLLREVDLLKRSIVDLQFVVTNILDKEKK